MSLPLKPSLDRPRLLLVAIAVVFYGFFALFPQWIRLIGVLHMPLWFADLYAILAANDAASLGRDPFLINPLDPLNRPHVYSHWWLVLRDLGLTRADNLRLGLAVVAGWAAVVFVWLRPRSIKEAIWQAAVVCSPLVFLAVERCNNDLIIFLVLAPVVPALVSERAGLRWLAVACVALAAGLKFYPAVAALVLLWGPPAEVRRRLGVAAILLGAVAWSVYPDYVRIQLRLPHPDGITTFGLPLLESAVGVTTAAGRGAILVGFVALAGSWALVARFFRDWQIPAGRQAAWLAFVLGATLLTGCYLAGANYGYRWVFALGMAPFLWDLRTDPTAPPRVRTIGRVIAVLLLFMIWADAAVSAILGARLGRAPYDVIMHQADQFSRIEQPLVAILFLGLGGFLAHFTAGALRRLAGREAAD